VEQAQRMAASEARAVGIHWTFAPMVDISRDARWGRIVEGAGEDPYLGSAMAAAQVRGFQGPYLGSPGGVIAGPKHFAGYGAALGGRDIDEVNLSDSELWNVYLPPFHAAIEAGAGNVMSAYMGLNGVPATGNRWLMTEVLRNTWGFGGFVVSDAGAVNSLTAHGLTDGQQSAAARALSAGVDMEMVPPLQPPAYGTLPAVIAAGEVSTAALDDAVRRVLEAKFRMGLFDNPYVDEARAERVLNDPAHQRTARIAAERSAVLLRNENGLLPLDRRRVRSIALIGPIADSERDTLGPWVFRQNRPRGMSVLAGLRAALGNAVRIDYSEGVRMPERTFASPFVQLDPRPRREPIDETAEIARAVELARNADVAVLVLGESYDMIGEGASRASFDLPGRQQDLLDAVVATGKPVVVVLMSARPLNLSDTRAAAIMQAWYPGSQGGAAIANLLLGDTNPGGKLPFSWPRSAAHEPIIYSHLLSHNPIDADRRYWDGSSAPDYPFGFGLSYTTFQYANLRVERERYAPGEPVVLSVDLTNTGRRAGDEVAQLYIHQRYGSAARPVRELKGFQRVVLRPGETRSLHFTLRPEDLRYWSSATRSWVQEESAFDVWVGGSSAADAGANFEVRKR
jgi:beta-glucosidase